MAYSELPTDELESLLPLTFQRKEKRDRPCGSRCPLGEIRETVTYEQVLYRSDDFTRGRDVRAYQIYYREKNRTDAYRPYETDRHHTFREALIEMCQMLIEAGVISLTEAGK
jgi:hypothetical protein